MSDLSPLAGVKRKLDFGAVRSPFDPQETCVANKRGDSVVKYQGVMYDLKELPSAETRVRSLQDQASK
jgi:hypothetical protein